MNIFYCRGPLEETIHLDPGESRHCFKVIRMKTGDHAKVVDGEGNLAMAVIENVHEKQCTLRVLSIEKNHNPLGYQLHIGIAPTKSQDRFEWFIEKAVEIGVTSITPLICERSERERIRLDRLEKVVIAAMKQSEKAYKPVLSEPVKYSNWVAEIRDAETSLIAHCQESVRTPLWDIVPGSMVRIAIGPEGDFTGAEIARAKKNGFTEISLGAFRLRTETAGIVACSLMQMMHAKKNRFNEAV